jgi:hypothetical protein
MTYLVWCIGLITRCKNGALQTGAKRNVILRHCERLESRAVWRVFLKPKEIADEFTE